MRKAFLASVILAFAWAGDVSAQYLPLDGRLYVDFSGLVQAGSQTIDQGGTFIVYAEPGLLEATQNVESGGLWDLGFGYRAWRDLSFGLGVSQFSGSQVVAVSGQVPHPLFFESPRAFASSAPTEHRTRAIYLQAMWRLPMPPSMEKLNVRVMGGPAHLRVRQGLAAGGEFTEIGPPFSAVNVTVTTVTLSKSATGFIGGVDIAYPLTPNIGVGMLLRGVGGSVELQDPFGTGDDITIDAGGFQAGGGVRLKF